MVQILNWRKGQVFRVKNQQNQKSLWRLKRVRIKVLPHEYPLLHRTVCWNLQPRH
jgi:hypothetical protein